MYFVIATQNGPRFLTVFLYVASLLISDVWNYFHGWVFSSLLKLDENSSSVPITKMNRDRCEKAKEVRGYPKKW
jgi:hypothetical protein